MNDHEQTFGAALRQAMPDPGHLDGFAGRLAALLDEIDAARGAIGSDGRVARRRWPWPLRRRWAALAVTAVGMAIVAAVFATTVGTPTRTSIVPTLPPATAAEVVARARQAFATATSLKATLVVSRRNDLAPGVAGEASRTASGPAASPEASGSTAASPVASGPASASPAPSPPPAAPPAFDQARYSLLISADGSYRQELISTTADPKAERLETFDATSGTRGLLQAMEGMDGASADVTTGMNRGFPNGFTDTMWYAAVAPALKASGEGSVSTGTYAGRPVWIVTTSVTPGPIIDLGDGPITADQTDHLQVTVDGETGFPVRVCLFEKGVLMTEYRLEGLVANAAVPEGSFTLATPAGAHVSTSDWGFRPVTLAQVKGIVGYKPLVSRRPPAGFKAAQVDATSAWYANDEPTPRQRRVYDITYRRGFDAITVTMRQADAPVAVDPIRGNLNAADSWNGSRAAPELVRLDKGALAGETARVVIAPLTTPHLWVEKDGILVVIAGTATRDELLQVAESLRVYAVNHR